MARISVIIVNYNGRRHLDELFVSLTEQTRPADEVILVDCASSDGSLEQVRESFPWVTLVPLAVNVGFAGGNNEGLGQASGEYIALLNNDTTVDPLWLAELERCLDEDAAVGAAVPKIYRADGSSTLDCAGASFNNLGFCWGRGSNQPDGGELDAPAEVAAATGCSMLLRRSALAGEPIFDQRLFMYYEELDLSLRLRGRGHAIRYVPTSIVYHKRSQGVKGAVDRPLLFQQLYGNRNRVKILAKYYPVGQLLRSLPLIVLSLAYWNLFFLRHGGPVICGRAVAGQLRYLVQGLSERSSASGVDAGRWLPWMKHHGLRDLLRLRAQLGTHVR